jgi:tetratricopeptide (TPR) repeat protein
MLVILVSFTKAINIPESILSFSKFFTVFCAAYILFLLLRSDKRYFRILVIVLVFVLISDSLTVIYNILLYISRQVDSIYEIKSIYSNKNILAAALFIKIPFALWLVTFRKGWMKKLGFFALFCAELAVFFMSTRAFYLGLISLSLVYGAFLYIMDSRNQAARRFNRLAFFFGLLVMALLIHTLTQHYLFPKSNDIYNKSSIERISTITSGESGRLDSWKRSAILFRQDPLLGVGTGNWKIRVLKYENPVRSGFTYMVKNHNDFIEIATETGVFGGLLYISLFAFLISSFLKAFFKPEATESSFSYLFIPAFGIFCYIFDAFFNFPADRPEVQSIFALFIGAGVAYSLFPPKKEITTSFWIIKLHTILFFLLLLVSSYVLLLNFNSLKLQRIVLEDLMVGSFRHSSSMFIEGFPVIPNVTNVIEPIAVQKALYLINEKKFQEAINILRSDRSSPYDGRRENFMATAFSSMGKNDSALVYALKVHELKPRYYNILDFICNVLESKGKKEQAINMLQEFVAQEKSTKEAWLHLKSLYWKTGKHQKAIQILDSASKYLPGDTAILKEQIKLSVDAKMLPYNEIYTAAMECIFIKNYPKAIKFLDEIISKEAEVAIYYDRRAYCYYYSNEFNKSINDVNLSIALGNDSPSMLNLRGVCFQNLGKMNSACTDFQDAAAKGDKDAANNVERFCKGK